jgi:DNA-binding winged helix-turn-helix (wHTH) protein
MVQLAETVEHEEPPEIDPALATIAVRLADEGIPVGAIARGLKVPSADLYNHLNEALCDGKIVELPKSDWPAGSSRAQRAIFAGTILENEETVKSLCVRLFKATRQQAAVIAVMLRRIELTKAQIHNILQENRPSVSREPTDQKMVDVVIFHIRKKLKPFGIGIETVWGTGYLITPKHREVAIKLLEEFSQTLSGVEKDRMVS